jgi:UDPglucose 6-dehydrogenase
MIISVIGQGKLGKPIADVFEANDYKVIRIDNDKSLGHCTHCQRLGDITFVVVPTPSMENDKFSSEYVENVLSKIKKKQIVVIVSTLYPGETDRLQKKYKRLTIVYNPTFVALGSVVFDFIHPDFILIGARNQKAVEILKSIYHRILFSPHSVKFTILTPLEAEIAKLTLNCYITTKITFANQIGNLCYRVGIKPDNILNAVGMDSRIGNKYFKAGLGYGGPCFPRDNLAMSAFMQDYKYDALLTRVIHALNREQAMEIVERIKKLHPKSIGFKSLSYKNGTDVTDCSQLKDIYDILKRMGYKTKLGNGNINLDWQGIIE